MLRTCSPSHNGALHHWGFELCCAFYVCSKCIFQIIPVFFSWLASIFKAYCESLFSLNCFSALIISLSVKFQNMYENQDIHIYPHVMFNSGDL